MAQISYSKIFDNRSILESKCPECCLWFGCKLPDCADPDICPQPETRMQGNYANKERNKL